MTVMEQSGIDLFGTSLPSLNEIEVLAEYANSSEINKIQFAEEARKQAEAGKKLVGGIGLSIVGQHSEAIELLEGGNDCAEKYIFLGRSNRAIGNFEKALENFETAKSKQADSLMAVMEKIATLRMSSKLEEAQKELKSCANYDGISAEYHYQVGRVADAMGEYETAIESYEKALDIDENHLNSLFHLAYSLDLRGDEEAALDYYLEITKHTPVRANVFMNLAILYEDKGEFHKAREYAGAVLDSFPNNARARLFLKDIESSVTMFYDEEREKLKDRRNKVLEIPISDFELSVRSRNCLRKMHIYTLGDLLRINESELLSYKNFGETSLSEIRSILESKGLRLGMKIDEEPIVEADTSAPNSDEDGNELAGRTVAELELSVRARRALDRLNIRTFAELVSKTEAELLGCKNFGITSLTEIKEKLTKHGLSLRKLE